jgi:hypothetical protein
MKKNKLIAIIVALVCVITAVCCIIFIKPKKPEAIKLETPYLSTELGEILLTDTQKSLTVDVSQNAHLRTLLETVEYYEYEQSTADLAPEQIGYVIALQTLEINVYSNSLVSFVYNDGTQEYATLLNNEFAYVSTVIKSAIVSFDNYSVDQSMKIKNTKGEAKEIDKQFIIDELSDVTFVKLGNKDHYELGDFDYTVTVGSDEIVVYENYVTKNGELYRIYEGNFDFLGDLTFDVSSGWLPWL